MTMDNDDSPKKGLPCIFPFTYLGNTYNECITEEIKESDSKKLIWYVGWGRRGQKCPKFHPHMVYGCHTQVQNKLVFLFLISNDRNIFKHKKYD